MWQVTINGPGYFGTPYELPSGITYLGRADNNDIVLSGDQVSRRHAKIEARNGVLSVEDLGSRNGTLVNGERLTGPRKLKAGDTIQVGENALALSEPSPAENARTDPLDVQQMQALGLHGADIGGEVLLERNVEDNPFLIPFVQAEELTPATLGNAPSRPMGELESAFLLLKITEKLTTATSLSGFLDEVVDLVVEVTHAKTGVALLLDERGKLVPAAVRHAGQLAQGEVPVSDAIIAEVARRKVALAVSDARGDARFANRESVLLYGLSQVLCVPMMRAEEELIGVLYLNRTADDGMPLTRLVDLASAVARMAANGVERWRQRDKALVDERLRKALERFYAPAIAERVLAEAKRPLGRSLEARPATVLMVDIAGFSSLAMELPPEQVAVILSDFYARMSKVILSFEGTLDKFVGDAAMAVFGAPYGRPDDASRAVRCALACRRKFAELVVLRRLDERLSIKLTLNTGDVVAGLLGPEDKLSFTALGQDVNVAAWMQSEAEPGQVLITGKTLKAIGARFDVRPLGERPLAPGVKVPLFEVLEEDSYLNTMPGV